MLDNIPIFVNASLIILYQSSLLVKKIVPGYSFTVIVSKLLTCSDFA